MSLISKEVREWGDLFRHIGNGIDLGVGFEFTIPILLIELSSPSMKFILPNPSSHQKIIPASLRVKSVGRMGEREWISMWPLGFFHYPARPELASHRKDHYALRWKYPSLDRSVLLLEVVDPSTQNLWYQTTIPVTQNFNVYFPFP